ncbi:hypothetical protein BGW36DRAFT_301619 [Talaromyces proteolyticus]|uniref:Uncharacterized protein n=1 Tax=Talaromyces proteolyticus TaxID=1131652 RepID=A0AAD4KII5_9EURO|nr:uncharacterized protein BGW36DRAFT_301619 [Talaromyces proteolyticus]KAH8693202.1 hypothetical protein BGW36DRAFT_301619 [Talaromyces proteolyticus]
MSSSILLALPHRLLARPSTRSLATSSSYIQRRNAAFSLLHRPRHDRLSRFPAYATQLQPQSRIPVPASSCQQRAYAELKPSGGKSEADLIVEELQELYDNAKDEFEIAVDSTNSSTIYAASDRESAREHLDQLVYVYTVYTEMTRASAAAPPGTVQEETVSPNSGQANADRLEAATGNPAAQGGVGEGFTSFAAPNYDPEYIKTEVKEEVKKRVGQRIRELRSAVERLEDTAGHE